MKRLLTFFLTAMLLLCAACSSPSAPMDASAPALPDAATPSVPAPPPPAPVIESLETIRWFIYYPDGITDEERSQFVTPVLDLLPVLNRQLQGAGLELKIDIRHEFDYMQTIAKRLAADDPYDLITLSAHDTILQDIILGGEIVDLTDVLRDYPNLQNALDPLQLEATAFRGRNYVIPSIYYPMNDNRHASLFAFKQPLADAGAEIPRTNEEFLNAVLAAHQRKLPFQLDLYDYRLEAFRRDYEEFPFRVSDDLLFLFDKDGKVGPYPGSSVFKKDVEFMARMADIASDSIVYSPFGDIAETEIATWQPLFASPDIYENLPDESAQIFLIAPDKPRIRYGNPAGGWMTIIPKKAGLGGLEFLNWVYASQENYDLAVHGVEGETRHYTRDIYGVIHYNDPIAWILRPYIGQMPFEVLPFSATENDRSLLFNEFESMPWDGFVFDAEPFWALDLKMRMLTLVGPQQGDSGYYISGGSDLPTVNHDQPNLYEFISGQAPMSLFDKKLEQLVSYGMDGMIKECQKQYAEYLSAKGWAGAP